MSIKASVPRLRLSAVVATFLALSGCKVGVEIAVSGPASAPQFELSKMGLLGGAPQIRGLRVVSGATYHEDKVIWSIDADDCVRTGSVTYGRAPKGFAARTIAPKLLEDRPYLVWVTGCGADGGKVFQIADGVAA